MPSDLADSESRRRALDPAQSFIVQAPAGSGKTELLVRRLLVLLAHVSEPERIVAITFTRKAAAEMRTRVIAAVRLARDAQPADPVSGELWRLARSALANDERHGWQLETYPTRLRIQTIDALSAALTRQMPWLARLGAPLRVVEDAEELYRAAATATVRHLGSVSPRLARALAELLTHLDNNLPRLTGLLVEMLRHRDQWLRHVIAEDRDADRRMAVERAWAELAESVLRAARAAVPVSVETDLTELAAFAGDALAAGNVDSAIVACRGLAAIPAPLANRLPEWQGLAELLLTKKDAWRRSISVKQGFAPGSRQRGAMQALLEKLSGERRLRGCLAKIRRLPAPHFGERQWQVLQALIEILPVAAAELQLVFGERGQVDFAEVTESARLALGAVQAPTDLALRLDYRIEHLLVDEFQDTSVSQFELLQQLTQGWQGGDGRTLFLVGDPMQSIYRFRAAEVGLFLSVLENGWGQIPMETLTLAVNFRSDRPIVDWINRTFPALFPHRNEPPRGAVAYVPFAVRDEGPTGGRVEVHPVAGTAAQEAMQVVTLVRAALDDPGQQSIAILVRSRLHLSAILPALKGATIPYHGVDIVPLSDQPVVIDLMALVRALLMPADRVAWLAVLRAPWCGLTLADLHVLAVAEEGQTVADNLFDPSRRALLSSDGRARAERCARILEAALSARGRGTLRTRVERTWVALGGPACIGADQLADAETLLALVATHESGGDLVDMAQLQRAVLRLWARPDPGADGRVQVMTLHKAKGLEFDTVIIPELAREPPVDRLKLLIWEEYARATESALLLAPLAESGREYDSHYRFVRQLHAEKEEFETLRLLYVGCTRARHVLHLVGQIAVDAAGALRPPARRSLQKRLWPWFEAVCQDRSGSCSGAQLELPMEAPELEGGAPLRRLASDWQLPRPLARASANGAPIDFRADAIEFAWAGETARQIGILVHSVLQWMGEDGLGAWDRKRLAKHRAQWRAELLAAGVPSGDVEMALGRVMSALTHVLTDRRAAWILDRDHQAAHNELKLTIDRDGRLQDLVIDRTFMDANNVRWIIDYKTSSHEGGGVELFLEREVDRYRGQLETYAEAMGAEAGGPIRLGIYFPLLKEWREWAYRT